MGALTAQVVGRRGVGWMSKSSGSMGRSTRRSAGSSSKPLNQRATAAVFGSIPDSPDARIYGGSDGVEHQPRQGSPERLRPGTNNKMGAARPGSSASKRTKGEEPASESSLSYALTKEQSVTISSYEEQILELKNQVDSEVMEKNLLLARQTAVERNLLRVNEFLEGERISMEQIMQGARESIHKERQLRAEVEEALALERQKCVDLEQSLQSEREDRIRVEQFMQDRYEKLLEEHEQLVVEHQLYPPTVEQRDKLKEKIYQVQVRALYHILNNIWRQRDLYYFNQWRWFLQDNQTLRHAEELRAMNSSFGATEADYEVEEPRPKNDDSYDVPSLDIYSMGADFGLITHETATRLSSSPVSSPKMSAAELRSLDKDGDGHVDTDEWALHMDTR